MKELPRRLLVAAVALPLLGWLLFRPQPGIFMVVLGLAALAALHELLVILGKTGHRPFAWVAYPAAAGFLVAAFRNEPSGTIQAATVLGLLGAQMLRGVRRENAADMGVTLLAILYTGWLPSLMLRLRLLDEGAQWVFALLAATWLYDSGAFFAGRTLGRTKLWPSVSPNKTWEGCVGGTVLSVGVLVTLRLLQEGHPEWMPLLPSVLTVQRLGWVVPAVCVAAQVGDLVESMFKRAADVKDSGALLPGHGGLLDKLDSFLFTGPLMYFFASIF